MLFYSVLHISCLLGLLFVRCAREFLLLGYPTYASVPQSATAVAAGDARRLPTARGRVTDCGTEACVCGILWPHCGTMEP